LVQFLNLLLLKSCKSTSPSLVDAVAWQFCCKPKLTLNIFAPLF